VDYSPWSCKESDTMEVTDHTHKSYTDLTLDGLVKSRLNAANRHHLMLPLGEPILITCLSMWSDLLTSSLSIRFHSGD